MEEQIIQFIKTEIHGNRSSVNIAPADDLLTSGLLASMDMVRVVEFLEQTYDIKIAPQDMNIDHFISVEAMANYVRSVQ